MITIKTEKGKFFFSSFISLGEEKEAQIDEILLSLFEHAPYILYNRFEKKALPKMLLKK